MKITKLLLAALILLTGCTTEPTKFVKTEQNFVLTIPYSYEESCTTHQYDGLICKNCSSFVEINESEKKIMLTSKIAKENNIALIGDVVIPEKIIHNGEEYTIAGIGHKAILSEGLFENNQEVTSITLPSTIQVIQDFAFNECTNLKKITFSGNNLIYIGTAAFQLCTSLETISLPDSVKYIGDFAFNHCPSLSFPNNTFILPSSLKKIGNQPYYPQHSFYNCGDFASFSTSSNYYKVINDILYTFDGKTIVSVPQGKTFPEKFFSIPKGTENLGELSFSRTQNIETLEIPASLDVSASLKKEEEIYLNKGNDLSRACYVYSSISKYFADNEKYKSYEGVLYSADMKKLIAVPNEYKGILNIPESVTSWEDEAIWSDVMGAPDKILSEITEINIPSTLENISEKQLETINFLIKNNKIKININNNYHFRFINNKIELTDI